MDFFYDFVFRTTEFLSSAKGNSWNWFNGLNREEWMVVLGIAATTGFVCLMLGMGNRK